MDLKLVTDRNWKNFEEHDGKIAYLILNRLLIKIGQLTTLRVRTQKEVGSMLKKKHTSSYKISKPS